MYIMYFNVSICFKMGSLYSYCGIITKLVYRPELSRIAGFCTYSNKFFRGGGGRTPMSYSGFSFVLMNENTSVHQIIYNWTTSCTYKQYLTLTMKQYNSEMARNRGITWRYINAMVNAILSIPQTPPPFQAELFEAVV